MARKTRALACRRRTTSRIRHSRIRTYRTVVRGGSARKGEDQVRRRYDRQRCTSSCEFYASDQELPQLPSLSILFGDAEFVQYGECFVGAGCQYYKQIVSEAVIEGIFSANGDLPSP